MSDKERVFSPIQGSMSRRNFLQGTALGALGVAGAASLGMLGCSPATDLSQTGEGGVQTATATATGFGGTVEVTLSVDTGNGAVVDAVIDGPDETPEKGGAACATMQAAMIEAQSIEVDAVSGATITSTAVKEASAMAYAKAMGGDADMTVHMEPGVYQGGAKGFWEERELPVSVKVNETAILSITLPGEADRMEHDETEIMLEAVKNDLVPRIIENQSLAVDATTGATASSNAVKAAVRQALSEALVAGGSSELAVSAFDVPVEKNPGEPIEMDVDILVVGLGSGGMMAMKSAVESIQSYNTRKDSNGLVSVLGIDRAGRYGGRSIHTHEACIVNPPKYAQIAHDGKDYLDAEAFRAWFMDQLSEDGVMLGKEECLDTFFRESGPTLDWLYDQGWIFGSSEEMMEKPGIGTTSFNVVLTSWVDPGSFEDRKKTVNRYYNTMLESVRAQGGDYMLNTEGYELLTEGDRVTGVKARNLITGQEYVIHAKAVITNTGGIGNCPELIEKLWREDQRGERKSIGMAMDTGEMIKAALEIGAGTFNADSYAMMPTANIDHWINTFPINHYDEVGWLGRYDEWTLNNIPHACGNSMNVLAVNKKGERFMNEATGSGVSVRLGTAQFYKSGNYHWRIIGNEFLKDVAQNGFSQHLLGSYRDRGDIGPAGTPIPEVYEGLDATVAEGMAFKADSLEELAGMIDMDPKVLTETVERYNSFCDSGVDEDFEKVAESLMKTSEPPFYAIKMMAFQYTAIGALDIDKDFRVLKADGVTPIEGLYAIGSETMGVLQNPNIPYLGMGLCQGWSWTGGRVAPINAAKYIHDTYGGFKEVMPFFDLPMPTR